MKLTGSFPFAAAIVLWLGACSFGLWILLQYQTTPGPSGSHAKRWPAQSSIAKTEGKPTLVMLAHPKCPCTRASVGELAWIMARAQDKVQAFVVFVKPAGSPDDWSRTDLCKSAASIPGVQVLNDEGGAEAKRLGAQTSGHTLVYDAAGALVFSGGITASRGHSGDNPGRAAVLSFLLHGNTERAEIPVFGCFLFSESAIEPTGKKARAL